MAKGPRSEGTSSTCGLAPSAPRCKLAVTSTGTEPSADAGKSGRNWRWRTICEARRPSLSGGFWPGGTGAMRESSCWVRSMVRVRVRDRDRVRVRVTVRVRVRDRVRVRLNVRVGVRVELLLREEHHRVE